MAKKFKDYYDDACARLIAGKLSAVAGSATFDAPSFAAQVQIHLRADPQRFVQKSVGNNLNDLMKAAPERAGEIIQGWEQEIADSRTDQHARAATRWIIRHGTRSLRKAQRAQS